MAPNNGKLSEAEEPLLRSSSGGAHTTSQIEIECDGGDDDDAETKGGNASVQQCDVIVVNNDEQPRQPTLRSWHTWANLIIFSLVELIGGFTFSLLSPFYTKEATAKGLTVTQTGMVYGSVFITTIIFSPIFGKYIKCIGSRNLFLYGTFVAGATNILFGFLEWVNHPTAFLVLSFATRVVSAIGESAFFCSVYPLATAAAPLEYRSTVLSVMETMFGLGMMVGPFIGGVLYEIDGFYFPFVLCGGALVLCTFIAACLLSVEDSFNPSDENEERTPFRKLLKMPCIIMCCLVLVISETSVTWYLPSLQPFLEDNFHLSTVATGAMFMVEGATYAAFSPLWGFLLDKYVSPHFALIWGCASVIAGYCLLGPAPFLPFLPQNVYLVGVGLFIQGSGVAAIFITTLVFMLNESVVGGAADNEQTRGMITSLWFISENLGGYFGSSLGGVTYDSMGFENSTLVVMGLQMMALVAVAFMWKVKNDQEMSRRRRTPSSRQRKSEETRGLLSQDSTTMHRDYSSTNNNNNITDLA